MNLIGIAPVTQATFGLNPISISDFFGLSLTGPLHIWQERRASSLNSRPKRFGIFVQMLHP